MRLWHKDLIDVLPNKQLKGQWRECCAIAKGIHDNGTVEHLLIKPIMDYPISHFCTYAKMVSDEMDARGIGHNRGAFLRYFDLSDLIERVPHKELFKDWHDFDYALICVTNLYEKHIRGGVSESDYMRVVDKMNREFEEQRFERYSFLNSRRGEPND